MTRQARGFNGSVHTILNWHCVSLRRPDDGWLFEPESDTNFQVYVWTRETGMRDLGTLPGDVNSGGLRINDRGEVVGVSIDASGNLRGSASSSPPSSISQMAPMGAL